MLLSVIHGLNTRPVGGKFKDPHWVVPSTLKDHLDAWAETERVYPMDSHAVFDTVEQIFEKWPWLHTDSAQYVVRATVFHKAYQEYMGGWRWHKWGPYLGDNKPQHEYLYDEGPDITQAVVVRVFELENGVK